MSEIPTEDRLALFGYGLFETLRVEGKQPEVPHLHYQRMREGAEILGLPFPEEKKWQAELIRIVREEIQPPSEIYALRLTLSGGSPNQVIPSQLFSTVREIPYSEEDYEKGIRVCYLSHPRNEYSPLTCIKSTNGIENLLGIKEAENKGAREGIWLNTKGNLTEGTRSNLFFIKKGVLYTPAIQCGCLPGTRRRVVLECARQLQIPVCEGELTPKHLEEADAVFLTNSLMGILPVKQIEDRVFYPVLSVNSGILSLQLGYKEYILSRS